MKKILIIILTLYIGLVHAQGSDQALLIEAERQYRQAKAHDDLPTVASTAVRAGEIHLQNKNFKRSTDFLLVSKEIYQKQNDSLQLAKVSCLLAENYYRTGNAKRYRDYIALAEQMLGKKTHLPEYLLLIDTQIGYYSLNNKPKQVQYLTDLKAQLQTPQTAKTSLVAPNTNEPVAAPTPQSAPLDASIGQEPVTEASGQIDLHQLAMILAVSIATLSFIGLLYFSYKDRRRSLEQKKNMEVMQSQILENLSRAIKGVGHNGNLSQISTQLADMSLIKAGQKPAKFVLEPVGPFMQSVAAPFLERAAQKNLIVISNLERSGAKQYLDKDTLETIVDLLANEALANSQPGDKLYFSATVEKGRLHLRMSYPHGPVNKASLPHLFEDLDFSHPERHNPVSFALLGTLVDWYDGEIAATHDGEQLRISVVLPLTEPVRHLKQIAASFL